MDYSKIVDEIMKHHDAYFKYMESKMADPVTAAANEYKAISVVDHEEKTIVYHLQEFVDIDYCQDRRKELVDDLRKQHIHHIITASLFGIGREHPRCMGGVLEQLGRVPMIPDKIYFVKYLNLWLHETWERARDVLEIRSVCAVIAEET